MNTIGDRLKYARGLRNLTQKDLAKAMGATSAAVSALETGTTKSPTPENLFPLARRLDVSAEWLITGRGEMAEYHDTGNVVSRYETPAGYLRFQVMGAGGAGPGVLNSEEPEVLQEVDIAEWQVRQKVGRTVSPDRVKLLTVRGHSMTPRIKHGDVVFVDIEDRDPMDGGIFVVLLHGHALV